jgi:hypothetical protein
MSPLGGPNAYAAQPRREAASDCSGLLGRAAKTLVRIAAGTDLLERLGQHTLGHLRVVGRLRPQPIAVRQAEESAEAEIGVGRDGALTGDDLAFHLLLMVVGDLDIFGAGCGPAEADAELVVDPDAVLTGTITVERRLG